MAFALVKNIITFFQGSTPTDVSDVNPLPVTTGLTQGLTDTELRASDIDIADSGEREYVHVVQLVTSSGDTVLYTPTSGKRVRLRWIYAINDPTASNATLLTVRLGAEEKYKVWAVSKRQRVTGPVDGELIINLSVAGQVAVTALIEEVD